MRRMPSHAVNGIDSEASMPTADSPNFVRNIIKGKDVLQISLILPILFLLPTGCWDVPELVVFLTFVYKERHLCSSFQMHLRILPPSMEGLNIPDVFGPLRSVCVSHAAIR